MPVAKSAVTRGNATTGAAGQRGEHWCTRRERDRGVALGGIAEFGVMMISPLECARRLTLWGAIV